VDKEYIDTEAVAALTGLSRSTLEKWRLRDDRIPFIKAGRVVRYHIEDVRGWMEARRVLSTSATDPGEKRLRAPSGS
jgi:excisionase family DNA binding protein